MSKIEWEYDLVERPFCQQLVAMGWQWLEGDKDVPEFTERQTFREVLLKERLESAIKRLNLRDGKPWLDDERVRRIIEKLERADGHRLMEVNESSTRMLLKGTEIEGLTDWNYGRNQSIRFIDFEDPRNNDFLVINQFKVELTSGRGHVIPDAVLHAGLQGDQNPCGFKQMPGTHCMVDPRSSRLQGVKTPVDSNQET